MKCITKSKIILSFCFAWGLGSLSSVFAQEAWTLRACVDRAVEKSISIQQSALALSSSEIDQKDAKAAFLPTLNASASHIWNIGLNQNITTGLLENTTTQFSSGQLNLNWDVYNGKQNLYNLSRSNLAILANQYRLDNMKDDVRLMVVNAYLQVVFNRENLKVQQSQYEITRLDMERTQALIDNGVLAEGSILELTATAVQQEQAIVNARNTLRLSKISLAQLLLLEDYDNFDIADEDYDVPASTILSTTPKEIYQKAVQWRNDIKALETDIAISEQDVKIVQSDRLPTVSLFYTYDTRVAYQDRPVGVEIDSDNPISVIGEVQNTGQSVITQNFVPVIGPHAPIGQQLSDNDGHSFGVGVRIPIFNRFAVRNNIERQELNIQQTKTQLALRRIDLENTVNEAYFDALRAAEAYEAAQKTLEARVAAMDFAKDRFDSGDTDLFEYNLSKQRVIESESQVIQAKYDYIFRLKVLEFYFGVPIEQQ